MKKGISPVVAVVLLIAIAVIAAVGVWYWVGAYTGEPNVQTSLKTYGIGQCNGTYAFINNNGGKALDSNAAIYSSSLVPTGAEFNFSGTTIAASGAGLVPIVNASNTSQVWPTALNGNYYVLANGTTQIPFSCSS